MSRTYRRVKNNANYKFYHAMDWFIEKTRNGEKLSSIEKELVDKFFRDANLKYFNNYGCDCWFCTSGKVKNSQRKSKLLKQIEKEQLNPVLYSLEDYFL